MTPGAAPARRGGDYVQTGDVHTYFEVHGVGDPIVLLHGGLGTVETFDGLTPTLAERFRVYVPQRRGHGRTADVDGPITYVNMAQDTIAFMDALGITGAHLVGFSDGAAVVVHVALERPELVNRLVLIGQPLNHDGLPLRDDRDASHHARRDLPPVLAQLYGAASPDGPEHFGAIIDKLAATWQTEPSFTLDTLATVTAPTLFMMGDNYAVTLEHADAVRRTIPGSQLAVVPGARTACQWRSPTSRPA